METPGPTPPQSQLLPNGLKMHSGYGSPPGSPSGRSALVAAPMPNSSALVTSSQEPPVPAKPVSPRPDTIQGMQKYERRVTEEMQGRLKDVLARLSGPLATYLRQSRHEYRPTVMRLAFLGHDADSVRPWIVVLCPELVKKRAERFFKKDMARRIYLSDEPGQESFQVAVVGQPPQPRAGEPASRVKVAPAFSPYSHNTSCSLQVKAEHDGVSRLATIGGYIVAICHDGTETVYGLTAGHIFPQTGYDSPSSDGPWDGSMPSPASSDSEDDDTITLGDHDQSRSRIVLENSIGSISERAWIDMKLAEISFSREARDRDWALVEGMRTTQIESLNIGARNATIVLGHIGEQRLLRIGFDAEVALKCILSQTPSMILTPSGHDFVPAYVLIPDASRRLRNGVSGTWVISQPERDGSDFAPAGYARTSRFPYTWATPSPATPYPISVYGQVVADDMFGDVYMIPLPSIMHDIKTLLNAAVVRLPESTKELWQILTSQIHREHADPESETNCKDLHHPVTSGKAKHKNSDPTFVRPDDYPFIPKPPNPTPLPEVVSWNWGSGQPGGKVAEVKEGSGTLDKEFVPGQSLSVEASDVEGDDNLELSESSEDGPRAKKSRKDAPWTSKEDLCLKRMRGDGASWNRIMEEFSDRSEKTVKKHWYKDLRYRARGEKPSASSTVQEQGNASSWF